MSSADILSSPARLDALARSGLLDKGLRERLELLCETAHELIRVPIVQVNVLDDQQQITIGGYPPNHTGMIMSVNDAGCQVTVASGELVSIDNTLLHPVLCVTPLVQVIGIRAYLGVPIFFDGQIMGAFCCADYEVRKWSYWEKQSLRGLARLAGLSVDRE